MQIGFFAVGIGPSADPELLALAARAIEQCGFSLIVDGRACRPGQSVCIKISVHAGRQDAAPDYEGRLS